MYLTFYIPYYAQEKLCVNTLFFFFFFLLLFLKVSYNILMKNSTWYKSFARIFHICLRFTKIRFFSQIPNFVTETNPDATNPIYSLSHFLSQQYIHFPNFPEIKEIIFS